MTPNLRVADGLAPTWPVVLADAQTNGGLLAAVEPGRAEALVAELRAAGVQAAAIGDVVAGEPARIEVG